MEKNHRAFLFKSRDGGIEKFRMGIQFAVLGAKALGLEEKAGLGKKIPTGWFLEETSP